MRKFLGLFIIVLIPSITIVLWIISLPIQNRITNIQSSFYSLGQLLALTGISLFAITLFLNTRLKLLENTFGGLNKVFPIHHLLGKISALLILLHPFSLFLSNLLISFSQAISFLFSNKSFAYFAGPIAWTILMAIIFITLYVNIPYHLWRFIHQFTGIAFLFASYHALNTGSDVINSMLRIYLYFVIGLGASAYFYRTILGPIIIKKYRYRVKELNKKTADILEVILTPEKEKVNFIAGQFVFTKFKNQSLIEEQHPFSIISSPKKNELSLAVKILGDFTSTLPNIEKGTLVKIEGPYGKFTQTGSRKNQIWIAGGIGITPFLSILKTLDPGKKVDLFYSVSEKKEAIYLNELEKESKTNKNFHFFLWESKIKSHLTAKTVKKLTKGLLKNKSIFICAPIPMIKDLKTQFADLGVSRNLIKSEEFKLAS